MESEKLRDFIERAHVLNKKEGTEEYYDEKNALVKEIQIYVESIVYKEWDSAEDYLSWANEWNRIKEKMEELLWIDI